MCGKEILMIIRCYSSSYLLEVKNIHLYPSTVQLSTKISHLASKAYFENVIRWLDCKTQVRFSYHTLRTPCACSCLFFHVWKVHSSTITCKGAGKTREIHLLELSITFWLAIFQIWVFSLIGLHVPSLTDFYVFTSRCLVRPYPPLTEKKSFSFCSDANLNSRLRFLLSLVIAPQWIQSTTWSNS